MADIAAQTATALALSAKVLTDHGEPTDASTANRWLRKASAAYNYARKMTAMHGPEATCTASSAATNCVGTGCETIDTYGNPVRGVRFPLCLLPAAGCVLKPSCNTVQGVCVLVQRTQYSCGLYLIKPQTA